ncbi:MAG: hypothetical protein LIP12_12850, partial [Clostridiales bacterium]|nr:hypothetical protein [Clostridiales bacterium]
MIRPKAKILKSKNRIMGRWASSGCPFSPRRVASRPLDGIFADQSGTKSGFLPIASANYQTSSDHFRNYSNSFMDKNQENRCERSAFQLNGIKKNHKKVVLPEVPAGIEPAIEVLQTFAL